jgi:hypothetical protein
VKRLAALVLAFAALPAAAFKLQALVPLPGADVHERITRAAYGMAGVELPGDVIAGVRWNDNPPALRAGALLGACRGDGMPLADGVSCWTGMMRVDRIAIETLTMREKALAPMRSHFGDMQFLHAMANRAGEPAAQTRDNALRWAQFAYRVARGEIGPRTKLSALRGKSLGEDTGKWLDALFRGASKKHWTVQDLFLARSSSVRQVAFGSLLHLVEDSYSASHVLRKSARVQANGCPSYDAGDPIAQFRTYVGQDAEKHGVCDDAPDWLGAPRPGSPIEAIAAIVRAYADGREWPVVRAILEEKVLRLEEPARAAGPGECFEWRLTEAQATASMEPMVAIRCD